MYQIGILGYGTVGQGVACIINSNQEELVHNLGQGLSIKWILDIWDFPEDRLADKIVHDFQLILEDKDICCVAETMGGLHPAYEFTKALLEAGKSVVTSNKEVVEAYGSQLMEIAKQNGAVYLFEASVGGGIPLLRGLATSWAGEKILEIVGILNGTTNYILSKMSHEDISFGEALARAKEKGYAELDTRADIEGDDACRKIAILTSIVSGKKASYQDIDKQGIQDIDSKDIAFARVLGGNIKLIARSYQKDGNFWMRVAPMIVSSNHPLYLVSGVNNGIVLTGNMLGECMYYGQGAGKLATGSGVVSDLLHAIKKREDMMNFWEDTPIKLGLSSQEKYRYLVRCRIEILQDMEKLQHIFGEVEPIFLENETKEGAFITSLLHKEELEEKVKPLGKVSFLALL